MREIERLFSRELVVVGVHAAKFPAERDPANLRAALQRLDVRHPIVADPDLDLWGQYAVRAWPTLVFVDPRGAVFAQHEGEFPLPQIRDLLADAVARFDAAEPIDRTPLPLDPLPAGGATLRFPGGVLADPTGRRLFVADSGHHRILVCHLDGRISASFGDGTEGFADGTPPDARFRRPRGMALDAAADILYVADEGNHAVRAIDLDAAIVRTVAGTGEQGYDRRGGPATETALSSPTALALRAGLLWIAMAGSHQLWTFEPATGRLRAAAGTGAEALHDGPLVEATFAQPSGLAADPLGGALYVADAEASAVRRVDLARDRVRRLVGRGLFACGDRDGVGDAVRLQHPLDLVAVAEAGRSALYLLDTYNHKLKRLDPATRRVETLAGGGAGHADGPVAAARFRSPSGLAAAAGCLYVADTDNHALRAIDLAAGTVRTLDVRE